VKFQTSLFPRDLNKWNPLKFPLKYLASVGDQLATLKRRFLTVIMIQPRERCELSIVTYCDVCLSVCSRNSKTTRPNFTKLCMLPWPSLGLPATTLRYDTLRTSGFEDDVIFHMMALWRVMCIPKRQQNTISIQRSKFQPNFAQR